MTLFSPSAIEQPATISKNTPYTVWKVVCSVVKEAAIWEWCCSIRHDLISLSMASFKEKYWDWKEGWQPGVQKCETSSIMGEERSTVTVSPLVRKRSRGILQSLSCSQSSFTWYLVLAVWETLGKRRSSVKDIDCWPQCFKKWKKTELLWGVRSQLIISQQHFFCNLQYTDWMDMKFNMCYLETFVTIRCTIRGTPFYLFIL